MKTWSSAAFALACVLACPYAAAQFKNTGDAIRYRQGVMTVMNHQFGRIARMVDKRTPFDARAMQASADLVATLASLPWEAFIAGSERGDTDAQPEIWTHAAQFKADAARLQDASARLSAAARTGNQDAIKTAFTTTSSACRACHDDFRKRP